MFFRTSEGRPAVLCSFYQKHVEILVPKNGFYLSALLKSIMIYYKTLRMSCKEIGNSNLNPLAPKGVSKIFSARLQHFLHGFSSGQRTEKLSLNTRGSPVPLLFSESKNVQIILAFHRNMWYFIVEKRLSISNHFPSK